MPMIDEAAGELAALVPQARPGRFQLEAAIQSVHTERATGLPEDAAVRRFLRERRG